MHTRILRLVLFLLAIIGAAMAGGLVWLRGSLPLADGILAGLGGLDAPVRVVRDRRGVPHIFAAGEADGAFTLGFAHAEDRLWQMEAARLAGAGRLAEILGEVGLKSDRLMRLLGLYHLAEEQFASLDAATRQVFEAYAAGVNARLERRPGRLPPEFILLGHHPAPWRPADSLVLIKLMAMRLALDWQDEALRQRLASRLPEARIDALWPPPPDVPRTVALPLPSGFLDRLLAALPDPPGQPRGASNAWAVAGSGTTTGKPILANDPHLGLAAPILWYLVRLTTPERSMAGATIAGMPLVIIGHNGRIAWGTTAGSADVEDLYVEETSPEDPTRYRTPEGTEPFAVRTETIRVQGGAPVILRTRATRHGPVVSDLAPDQGNPNDPVLALAATYLTPDDHTPEAIRLLGQARDWPAFLAAMERFHAPQMNILYADTAGGIGFTAAGRVPVRRSGRGRWPQPGWTGEADWTGFIPASELPRVFDPPRGRIVSANNRIAGSDFPHFLGETWDSPYRALRIEELLDAGDPLSPAGAGVMQLDIRDGMARHLLPLLLAATPEEGGTPGSRQTLRLLRGWDGSMDRGRPEPLLFVAWLREINRALYADAAGPELFPQLWQLRPLFVARVLTEDPTWCNDDGTPVVEDCRGVLAPALERALAGLAATLGGSPETWRWGELHKAQLEHRLLASLPLLGRWPSLSRPSDGGEATLNRGSTWIGSRDTPFAHVHGPGLRVVFDLADLDRSRFIIATGQSGHPLSPHWGDLVDTWQAGGAISLSGSEDLLAAGTEGTLTLRP